MPEIDFATVIFAIVALFVAFKLRSVLGTRNDDQRPTGGMVTPLRRVPAPGATTAPELAPVAGAAVTTPPADRWKGAAEPQAWAGLDAIAAADPSFNGAEFVAGAKMAYDMVVHAFAAGDSATLRGLMGPEAFANFDNAIRARAAAGQVLTTTVVSIDDAKIVAAQLVATAEQATVRFVAKLASVTRDRAGEVVEGSATDVADHIDLWTFVRDIRSRDPNWRLTETHSEH